MSDTVSTITAEEALRALKELNDVCVYVKAQLDKDIPNGDPVHPLSAKLTWPLSTAAGALRGCSFERPKQTIRELITLLQGKDRVTVQPLFPSTTKCQTRVKGARVESLVTFRTDQIVPGDLINQSSKVGFVVWVPRDRVE